MITQPIDNNPEIKFSSEILNQIYAKIILAEYTCMHNGNIKTSTHNDTVGTLETPMWGKSAKRGALLGFQREARTA
jgi:hypothetical protein